jgi:thiol-disulfide isomerase/thioredoxin
VAGAMVGCVNNDSGKSTDPDKSNGGRTSGSDGGVTVQEIRAAELEKAIKDQKGKVVLVDCWATWCPPCVRDFPHLVERHKKYSDKGLVCMSLAMDKLGGGEYDKNAVLSFLTSKGATFQNFIAIEPGQDKPQLNNLLGDFSSIPTMVLFDRNGRRVWTSGTLPNLNHAQVDLKIESLLADRP